MTWDYNDDGLDDLFAVVPTDSGMSYRLFDGASGKAVDATITRLPWNNEAVIGVQPLFQLRGDILSSDNDVTNLIYIRRPLEELMRPPIWDESSQPMEDSKSIVFMTMLIGDPSPAMPPAGIPPNNPVAAGVCTRAQWSLSLQLFRGEITHAQYCEKVPAEVRNGIATHIDRVVASGQVKDVRVPDSKVINKNIQANIDRARQIREGGAPAGTRGPTGPRMPTTGGSSIRWLPAVGFVGLVAGLGYLSSLCPTPPPGFGDAKYLGTENELAVTKELWQNPDGTITKVVIDSKSNRTVIHFDGYKEEYGPDYSEKTIIDK